MAKTGEPMPTYVQDQKDVPVALFTHQSLIQRFKDKEKAKTLNLMLLEIENLDPKQLETVEIFMQGVIATLKTGKKTEEGT